MWRPFFVSRPHADLWTSKLFGAAMAAVSQKGYHESAVTRMDKMKEAGLQPNVFIYNCLLDVHAKDKNWEKTLELFREMQTQADLPTPNSYSYGSLLKAYANCGMADEATAVLEEMKTEGSQVPLVVDSYRWAITACGAGGKWERAVALLKEIEADESIRKSAVTCYNAAIDACAKNGQIDQAMVIFQKMKEEGSPVSPIARTYGKIISSRVRARNFEEAASLIEELLADERIIVGTDTYAQVIAAYVETEEYQEALKIFFTAYDPGQPASNGRWLFQLITGARKDVEPWEAAVDVLAKLEIEESSRPDVSIYKAVIQECRKAGQWEKAVETLRKISNAGIRPNSGCYLPGMWPTGGSRCFER